jgi:hypothetical protein
MILGLGQLQNGVNGLLGGSLNKTAGVHYDKVSLEWVLYWLVASILESPQDNLTIN